MKTLSRFSIRTAVQLSVAAGATVAVVFAALQAHAVEKPKYTIEEIMKKSHKGDDSLAKRAIKGVATPAEIKQLLEYYKVLALNEPPKGDLASWKTKTAALIAVTQRLANGDQSAQEAFKKAANCKACHTDFKPEKEKK